ncbi:DUF1048 domain-containing protein [Leucobacter sp. UT-8R-CII-1-4]|uniref:DUF1048 domain-containing protein n=1 Tax=Leucobacter sp. UT-8R-CII-1-4 TaxID=3040075 RepID=UPI0024A99CA1|nr:DUF1048 domain-containing protein [Leucobacter sp. UT-8R-CII-1-4]MDI6023727.1 DUF1048 domain-containing protein [Leucobacter sp. UT-8R-CII-1-4]
MAAKWIETVIGPLEQKKQYREAKARLQALPANYRAAAEATNRYLMYYGGVTDGDTTVQMYLGLVELWEQAAADQASIASIVGDDPVEFAETFAQAYGGKRWIDKERARLVEAIETASRGGQGERD